MKAEKNVGFINENELEMSILSMKIARNVNKIATMTQIEMEVKFSMNI